MGMNDNAKLYEQRLSYNKSTGPYQSLSLPWWVRTPKEVYAPVHGCHIEPLICGEEAFRRISQDFENATSCIDIISWGFDPGMVLVRGAAGQSGVRAGDLLNQLATRKTNPVKIKILIWHDDVAAHKLMKNIPGYYGLAFPAIGCKRNKYYSEDHQFYNAEWFSKAIVNEFPNIEFRVRHVPLSLLAPSLEGEISPNNLAAFAAKCYATHHQKMILVDYDVPRKAVGYVMGHNFVTDFWDTPEHKFQDPRRERFYDKDPAKAWAQGPRLSSDGAPYVPSGTISERDKATKENAVRAYLANSKIAKPYQDVSCRLRGPILWSLNHNFCQGWEKSERPKSLFGELLGWAFPFQTLVRKAAEQVKARADMKLPPAFVHDFRSLSPDLFAINGPHSVQLLRTQPVHGEKTIKECYANLLRQMQHYIFIQNQYVQYQPWAEHLKECVQNLRKAGYLKPVYVFILTSTPESDGMDLPTYDVASGLGQSECMVTEHDAALARAKEGKAKRPVTPNEMQKSGINVAMGSMWTCAELPKVGVLRDTDYEEIYIHAKVAVVDDAAFTLGSANLNLRSMVMDSELNVLSNAMDVAYKLRCDLFAGCTGKSGPPQFGDMAGDYQAWLTKMAENSKNKEKGRVLDGQISKFLVNRQPGLPVV